MSDKYILIYSKDEIEWERYGSFVWDNYYIAECALCNDKSVVSVAVKAEKGAENYVFDLVSEEYFNQFKHPYL